MCFFLIYYCKIVFMYIDYVTFIYCICSSQVSRQSSHPQNRTAAAQTPKTKAVALQPITINFLLSKFPNYPYKSKYFNQ